MTEMTDPDAAWAPERIWLLRDAGDEPGHHLWCQDPDPAGDGTESIAYVRKDALGHGMTEHDVARLAEIREWLAPGRITPISLNCTADLLNALRWCVAMFDAAARPHDARRCPKCGEQC